MMKFSKDAFFYFILNGQLIFLILNNYITFPWGRFFTDLINVSGKQLLGSPLIRQVGFRGREMDICLEINKIKSGCESLEVDL